MSADRARRRRLGVALVAALTLAVPVALPGPATAQTVFRPRAGFAMGLEPIAGRQEIAAAPSIPVAYHGGSVMRNVTVHSVFWAPAGYRFDGSPGAGALGYQALVEQFLADAARDSGTTTNVFSVLAQYGDETGPGSYRISYAPAADAILDTHPYPARADQCPSPSGIVVCVTDLELERELNRLIGPEATTGRGLHDLWLILLPPDVDTCTGIGTCATNAFAGYHSEFDTGMGPTIYSAIPDPLVELTPPPGSDPQGNPEAESTLDTIAHEAVEAMTDPLGTAWMDPNGYETADKCETGPQESTPLGYAPDGSPYNQVIGGHQYLIQDVWSNGSQGCVASSIDTVTKLPLTEIDLRQYSPQVSGRVRGGGGLPVIVELARAGTVVGLAQGHARADGTWGPLTLRSPDGSPQAVGDDRDQLDVGYGFTRSSPPPDLIQTGSGGNPFTESGYTGWYDLDNGYAVHRSGRGAVVMLGPCSQTGVLTLRVGAALTAPPTQLCQTESDAAVIPVGRLGARTIVTVSSEDNRAESFLSPGGALVRLTATLGEPGSVSALGNSQLLFTPTGFPACVAFLRIGAVRCSGLVARARYRLAGNVSRASSGGVIFVSGIRLRGGPVLGLVDAAGRRLTTLHVAHLRVAVTGGQTQVSSGRCEPGAYWGPPVTRPPTSSGVGSGISGNGTICPLNGRARGLPVADIAQIDPFSGGQTITQVPQIESTAPIQDETLYGAFVASAQSGLPAAHGSVGASGVPIALTISAASSHRRVFVAGNVDTAAGVPVPALAPGSYSASWVLRDANGDTRTLVTRFGEA
jgi:hypothetical protein